MIVENIGIVNFITVSTILFCIGLCGIFMNRRNIILILMSLELMLLAVNINFVVFSAYLQDLVGQIFSIFILTVAGAEAAIGLAILVAYNNNRGNIEVSEASSMKG